MEKLNLLAAAENQEHLERHADSSSLTIGSKALRTTSEEDVKEILAKTDKRYETMIDEQGNPGRQVFGIKTDRWVGTDAVVPVEELEGDRIFKITREPGTRGEADILVAIVDEKDMPKTNVVHAIYGPYGPTGNAGIYTMMFGDPGEPFPRQLDETADERTVAFNEQCKEYWYGKDGKGGHVFLATPQEMQVAIEAMREHGLPTQEAEKKLAEFENNPISPIKEHKPTQVSNSVVDLGKIYLKPIVPVNNKMLQK